MSTALAAVGKRADGVVVRGACRPAGGMTSLAGMTARAVVYVLAKAPRPGLVKTRLCPPLSPAEASRLASAFLEDTLGRLAGCRGLDVRLALDAGSEVGSEESGARDDALPQGAAGRVALALARTFGVPVEGQGDGDLGVRMARLMARGLASGLPTVLVGSDCPDLPLSLFDAAADVLARADVVLAPSKDGGYVLAGARRRVPSLFEIDAPWSSDRVWRATCEAIERSGCSFEAIDGWDDVDDAAALGRLASRLGAADIPAAPVTARLLAEWRRQGVRF